MKKFIRNLLSSIGVMVAVMFGLNFTCMTAFADEDEGCSAATLNGSYGIETTGEIVAGGPVGAVAEAGIIRFDGIRNVSQTTTVSLNGAITRHRSSVSGFYEVFPDCTGDARVVIAVAPGVTITSTADFVIVDHGREIRMVNTGTGRVLLSNARKQ